MPFEEQQPRSHPAAHGGAALRAASSGQRPLINPFEEEVEEDGGGGKPAIAPASLKGKKPKPRKCAPCIAQAGAISPTLELEYIHEGLPTGSLLARSLS